MQHDYVLLQPQLQLSSLPLGHRQIACCRRAEYNVLNLGDDLEGKELNLSYRLTESASDIRLSCPTVTQKHKHMCALNMYGDDTVIVKEDCIDHDAR